MTDVPFFVYDSITKQVLRCGQCLIEGNPPHSVEETVVLDPTVEGSRWVDESTEPPTVRDLQSIPGLPDFEKFKGSLQFKVKVPLLVTIDTKQYNLTEDTEINFPYPSKYSIRVEATVPGYHEEFHNVEY